MPLYGCREMGKRVVCSNNLKQNTTAAFNYAADYDREFPPGQATISSSTGTFTTYSKNLSMAFGLGILHLEGYQPSRTSMYCPSWEHPDLQLGMVSADGTKGGWPVSGFDGPTEQLQTSFLYRSTFGPNKNKPVRLSRDDSSQPFLADHWERQSYMSDIGSGAWVHWQEGYELAYIDGHVEWFDDRNKSTIIAVSVGQLNIYQNKHVKQENYWRSFFEDQ